MSLTHYFSGSRFGRLVVRDLVVNAKTLLITVGAILGSLLVINIASVPSGDQWRFHQVFFPLTLLIGGHVVTSLAFTEMHNRGSGYLYLTMPGSILEKFLVKLLLTSLGWVVIATVAYGLFSILAAGLTQLFFGIAHPLFNPFRTNMLRFIHLYVVTQSVTLLGAIYFKKLHLVKTVLSASALVILGGLIFALFTRIIFWRYFDSFSAKHHMGYAMVLNFDQSEHLTDLLCVTSYYIKFFFWWLMAPLLWVIGYFRLKDTEV